jgi:hypothetical protein
MVPLSAALVSVRVLEPSERVFVRPLLTMCIESGLNAVRPKMMIEATNRVGNLLFAINTGIRFEGNAADGAFALAGDQGRVGVLGDVFAHQLSDQLRAKGQRLAVARTTQ